MKVFVVLVLMVAGLLFVGLAQSEWKLAGVIMISTASSFGDMIFYALTGFYQHSTVGAYSAGLGLAGVLASLYYLGKWRASVGSYLTKSSISISLVLVIRPREIEKTITLRPCWLKIQ